MMFTISFVAISFTHYRLSPKYSHNCRASIAVKDQMRFTWHTPSGPREGLTAQASLNRVDHAKRRQTGLNR